MYCRETTDEAARHITGPNISYRLNREFRRRTKTQASFSTEAAALTVLFGLVAVGQIVFRKIDGHQELAAFLVKEQWCQAA